MKIRIIISLFLLAAIIIISCKSKETEAPEKDTKIPVKVTHASRYEVAFPVRSSGMLGSKKEMKLSFKTGGLIDKIYVEEGQMVKEGQVLATLNLSEIEAQVNLARLGKDKAQRDLQRAENLYADSVATLEQLQNAKTALEYASSQLNIAAFNRQHSVIKAPARGKILKRLAEVNEMIGPGHPLFLYASLESDWVLRTALSDVDLMRIEAGDRAKIYFDAFPDETFEARIEEIATFSDPYTGTYEVELKILKPRKNFVTGLIGTAQIIPHAVKTLQALPVMAIHEAKSENAFIYLIQNDTGYYKKRIRINQITDSLIYFDTLLDTSEQVILEGAEYLKPGSGISIVE